MGAGHSRDDLSKFSDSDRDDESREEEEEEHESKGHHLYREEESPTSAASADELADIGAKLESLRIGSGVKLYRHVAGKWVVADKRASYSFRKHSSTRKWFLGVEPSVDAEVGPSLQVKPFPDQRRVDFVANGAVWALRFPSPESYRRFYHRYLDCSFENTHGLEPTDENKIRVFGADFLGWVRPDADDDSIWEDADDSFGSPAPPPPPPPSRNLFDEFEEAAADVGIQSLTLGAMDNSFLLGDSAIQVVRNSPHGIHGKGLTVRLAGKDAGAGMQKGVLMKGETNMMVMGPARGAGVDQVDIETGKIVAEWKFEKDGAPISMRDITNESKAAQLDPSESTFLGLDDNRLCRWDVRDRHGIVSTAFDSPASSPVLTWTQGHQFSRGTNFRCFATTGDGSIVVGSSDGKIRLYSKSSMRMAKTAFPGLGSPITHVDVTYDGKWILGTTDTYLILVCTVFKDKDGKEKTGFGGRMGNKIAAPRLLKLTPLDSYLAGTENKFHGGQFSWVTENGKQERHLVATVGKFSIIWNFHRVKESGHECFRNQEGLKSCYCYRIVLKDESIVDSRFMHDKFAADTSPEAPLVVATPQKVSSISMWNRR